MNHHFTFVKQHPAPKKEPTQSSVRSRLAELLKLEDGWLNGEGKALLTSGAEQFIISFEKHFRAILPKPYLFPAPNGNLQAEWVINKIDITLSIDLSNQSALYHASSDESEQTDETNLDLTLQSGWQKLNQKLTALSKS